MIKRYIIGLISILAFATSATACICHADFNEQTFTSSLKRYDFIALVHVKTVRVHDSNKFYPDRDKPDYATIEILELFKGEKTDSLQVWGIGTSCEMGVKPNSTWIMYGFGQNGKYSVQSCTFSQAVNLLEKEDVAFNRTSLYQLKEIFGHSLPVLQNGIHEDFFPSGELKSRFIVANNKLESNFYYKSNSGYITSANYHEGKLHGLLCEMKYGSWLVYVTTYYSDSLFEKVHYKLDKYDSTLFDLTTAKGFEKLLSLPSKKQYEYQILADRSTIVRIWDMKGQLSNVSQNDPNGINIFHIFYYDTGEINGNGILDQDGTYTYTGFYKNGTIERKIITEPDKKTRKTIYYNPDGTVKSQHTSSP